MSNAVVRLWVVVALFGLTARSDADETAQPAVRVTRDIVYETRPLGGELKLDLSVPNVKDKPKPPLVVFIHGGGWTHGDKSEGGNVAHLAESGFAVASIQYRFSQTALFPAQIEDCRAAVRFLKSHADEYGYDASCYGVIGASAGGHLAALLGVSKDADLRPAAAISLFCPTNLPRHVEQTQQPGRQPSQSVQKLIGGDPLTDDAARERALAASPVTHVHGDAAPFLLVHGTADPLVHPDQTSRFADALREAGAACEIEWVADAPHAGPMFWTPQLKQRYAAFLRTHLTAE